MRNVTLISTVHEEKGLCTISALHQILERARPEVIFLEIPPPFYRQFFEDKSQSNLESNAVNGYMSAHSETKPIPVDVYEVPGDFWPNNERLYRRVNKYSAEYGMLVDRHSQYVEQYGFAYLNSKNCIDMWLAIDQSVKAAVEGIGQAELSRSYASWKNVIEHRDQEMMKNIKKYCEENVFNSAVFLVGAAHRSAIVEKAKNLSLASSVTINWNFDKYDGLIGD